MQKDDIYYSDSHLSAVLHRCVNYMFAVTSSDQKWLYINL